MTMLFYILVGILCVMIVAINPSDIDSFRYRMRILICGIIGILVLLMMIYNTIHGNKKVIVFDVDGVILNFAKPFSIYMRSHHNSSVPENPISWNFDWKGTPDDMFKYINKFIDCNIFLPLMDTSVNDFIRYLRKKYKIIIVTAYPNKPNRIQNLIEQYIYYDDIRFVNQQEKVSVINSFNPVAIFEDCPDVINDILKLNDKVKVYVPSFWNYTKGLEQSRLTYYNTFMTLYNNF